MAPRFLDRATCAGRIALSTPAFHALLIALGCAPAGPEARMKPVGPLISIALLGLAAFL